MSNEKDPSVTGGVPADELVERLAFQLGVGTSDALVCLDWLTADGTLRREGDSLCATELLLATTEGGIA
jgi:hypothetical protein